MSIRNFLKALFTPSKYATEKKRQNALMRKAKQEAGWMSGAAEKKDKTLVQTWKQLIIEQGGNPTDVLLGIMQTQVNAGGVTDDWLVGQKVQKETADAQVEYGKAITISNMAQNLTNLLLANQQQHLQEMQQMYQALKPQIWTPPQQQEPQEKRTKAPFSKKQIAQMVEQAFQQVQMQQQQEETKRRQSLSKSQKATIAAKPAVPVEEEIKQELLSKKGGK